MAYFSTTIAHGSPGAKTVSVGFQPSGLHITVGSRYNTTDSYTHLSLGQADGTYQHCDSIFQDSTGGRTVSTDNKLVSVFERVGGNITETLQVTFTSFTATQVKYNVVIPNGNYNLNIEVWG